MRRIGAIGTELNGVPNMGGWVMINRRNILLAAAALVVPASGAAAQDYPTRPITMIVPYTAGGPTDIVMRAVCDAASKILGQPIIVENRAGGGGTVGPSTMVATAKPDGYMLSQIPDTLYRLPLMQDTTYDVEKDFTYIINLTGYTFGVITKADSRFRTWQDVVDYARANPGKLVYGSSGAATGLHIGMERLSGFSGIKMKHLPFNGSAEANAAAAGGHVMIAATGASAKPLADAGKVRFLNVWTANRVSILPDTPTLKELGYPYVILSPFGIAGPKGLDSKVVAKLHDAFRIALDDPSVEAILKKMEMVKDYKNGEDYRKMILSETEAERAILREVGMLKK